MKKLSIMALAAAALLTTACSTSDSVETAGNPTDGKGAGFINVAVSLPTSAASTSTTRAWAEGTDLDDGSLYEYDVKEVLLVIFGGADEATATVQQVVSPAAGTWNDETSDDPKQVTQRKNYVVKLREGAVGPYWVLAVLNGNGVISMANETTVSINGTAKPGATLSDLQAAIDLKDASKGLTRFANDETNGSFFMTNAVLSKIKSGTAGITWEKGATILSPMIGQIFESESEAAANNDKPSFDVYVERGLAKVTLTGTISFDSDIKISSGTLGKPAISSWVLDNTNKSSYIVRKVNQGDWGLRSQSPTAATEVYRFVGYSNVDAVASPITTAYRTYWSPDPNYSSAYSAANFYEPKTKTFPADASKPQYCYENTFDVAHQSYQNTTRAVVKVDLNGGTTFYTVGEDRKTLYTEADAKKKIYERLVLNTDFQTWFAANRAGTTTLDETIFKSLTWSFASDKAGGIHATDVTIDGSKLAAGADKSLVSISGGAAILKEANAKAGKINRFVNGAAYYAIRIKHFGDDLTPWNKDEYTTKPKEAGIDDIYPVDANRDANYLGRYGVLRNNWYQLVLGKILKIGHPIVPWLNPDNKPDDPKDPSDPTDPTNPTDPSDPTDPTDPNPEDPVHPDDSLDDSYINARINILSWALRLQNWNLK